MNNIKNIEHCVLCCMDVKLVARTEGGTQAKGMQEQDAEEDIWD
jgi:hypothetical protein